MDTYLCSGEIKIPKKLAIEIVEYINESLLLEKDERKRKLLQSIAGIKRFQWLSQNEN